MNMHFDSWSQIYIENIMEVRGVGGREIAP